MSVRCWRPRRIAAVCLPGATAALLGALVSCTINPVTGQRELALVTAADEVAIGNEQYAPSQQMQGGEYLLDPALTSYVRNVGNRLAAVSDRALPYEFVILNSSVPNAWALPGGKIAVNRGLLTELQSEAELAAVLGHEIVHAAARHGAQSLQRGLLLQGAVAIAAVAARNRDFSSLAVGAAGLGAQLINTRNGREDELEADAYGMRYMSRAGYDPSAAISLQETFVRLASGRAGGGWLAGLFATHPPSAERVAANRATAATLPPGGVVGRDEYQNATAQLRRNAPGYAALDSGRARLAEGDLAGARRDAETARRTIPREADVDALIGDIELADGHPDRAATAFAAAVALNGRFFYYTLRQGDALLALDRIDAAASAYSASLALLPTADAYLGLGRAAERQGNTNEALVNYGRAAESSGAAGTAARRAQVRLDLPANPGRYLMLATALDANGQLVVDISNPTDVAVEAVELTIRYIDAGQVRAVRRIVDGAITSGRTRRFQTGIGPLAAGSTFDASFAAARVVAEP